MTDPDRPGPARRLVVLRHAKSDWPSNVADHERPLGERGRRDAPAAGQWLRDTGWTFDHVACSTALRASDTWLLAAGELADVPVATFTDRVYHADVDNLVDIVREPPAEATTVLLVGHNPALQGLVLTLADDTGSETFKQAQVKFPSSAIAVLDVACEWTELAPGRATLTQVVVPRG